MGYSPWGRKDSDTTERLHFTSCILVTSEILVVPSHPNLALPTQGRDEDSQRLGAGRCDVTWGYRGYLGAFWFQPPVSLAQPPTSKGTWRVVQSRGGEPRGRPPHKTYNFILPLKHTPLDQHLTPSPLTTSASQQLQPVSPTTRVPAARQLHPFLTRPTSRPERLHSQLASSGAFSSASRPSRPVAWSRGSRTSHRLLQIHICNSAASAAGTRYPGSERSFRERRKSPPGGNPDS